MSVDAYLNKEGARQPLPKINTEGVIIPDGSWATGISPDGTPVNESVQEMVTELKRPEEARRQRKREQLGEDLYDSVAFYDPVLASHCRLTKP